MDVIDDLQKEVYELFERMTPENKIKALTYLENVRREQNSHAPSHDSQASSR